MPSVCLCSDLYVESTYYHISAFSWPSWPIKAGCYNVQCEKNMFLNTEASSRPAKWNNTPVSMHNMGSLLPFCLIHVNTQRLPFEPLGAWITLLITCAAGQCFRISIVTLLQCLKCLQFCYSADGRYCVFRLGFAEGKTALFNLCCAAVGAS